MSAQRLAPLRRLLLAAITRYEELGTVKGNLRLPALTEAERVALTGLTGEYVKTQPGETLVFSLRRLEALLVERGLAESLPELAVSLTGAPPVTKAERQAQSLARFEELLLDSWPSGEHPGRAGQGVPAACPNAGQQGTPSGQGVPSSCPDTGQQGRPSGQPLPCCPPVGRALAWREALIDGTSSALALLQREFNQLERAGEPLDSLSLALSYVTSALDQLPVDADRTLRLPVFANQIAADPHAFDPDRLAGRLLLRALAEGFGARHPEEAVERGVLLATAGLLPDGVSSTVATFGLTSAVRQDATPDRTVEGAWVDSQVLICGLRQVATWRSVSIEGSVLYVVENPPVFEELVDTLVDAGLRRPVLCTSGFLSVAAYRLLDLAVAQGLTIMYGGDFDPNGLTILARLLDRYGSAVQPWRMSAADYLTAAAHPGARDFTEAERRRLATVEGPLAELAAAMLSVGKAAYQEALLPQLINDCKKSGL